MEAVQQDRVRQFEDAKLVLNEHADLLRISNEIPEDYNVLDFGCGCGSVANQLLSGNILGVDESEKNIELAKTLNTNCNLKYKVFYDASALSNNCFDRIYSFNYLDERHVNRQIFNRFYDSLRHNGDIVLTILNSHGLCEIVKEIQSRGAEKWSHIEMPKLYDISANQDYFENYLISLGFSNVYIQSHERYQLYYNNESSLLSSFNINPNDRQEFLNEVYNTQQAKRLIPNLGKTGKLIAVPYSFSFVYAKKL